MEYRKQNEVLRFYLKHYLRETPVINWKMLKKRATGKWNEKLLLYD